MRMCHQFDDTSSLCFRFDLLRRLVVIRCGGRIYAAGDTGEETVPEGDLSLHAELLVVRDVVLGLVLLGLDKSFDEVVVLHFGHLLYGGVLTDSYANVLNVTGLEHHHGADAQCAYKYFFHTF